VITSTESSPGQPISVRFWISSTVSDSRRLADERRNAAAAETFLRRSLEAVFDIGRHILAKTGHGELAQEYKSIARGLGALGAVSGSLAAKLVEMAGYRNRLVHLYWEVTADELYRILQDELDSFVSFVKEVMAYLDTV